MKKTYQEILEIDSVVANLYEKDKDLPNTKFGYAYSRYHKKSLSPALDEFKFDKEELKKQVKEKLVDALVEKAIKRE